MSRFKLLASFIFFALVTSRSASAQEFVDPDRPALVLFADGGGYSPLSHLDDSGQVDFTTGYTLGGGIGYQFNRHVAVRGNLSFARDHGRDLSANPTISGIDGTEFNRLVYDADVQLRLPFSSGVAPYVFVGGGLVNVRPAVQSDEPSFTKGAGKVGVGLDYRIPRSNVGLYVSGTGWLYTWDRNGFDRAQFDTTWSGGISYRFGM